jgi:hypothetical protein
VVLSLFTNETEKKKDVKAKIIINEYFKVNIVFGIRLFAKFNIK